MYPSRPLSDRFLDKCTPEPNSGCWLWHGAYSSRYGWIIGEGSQRMAHRVSYELHNGPIPDGMNVCHRCDVSECVNPGHLFLGTQKENLEDASRKGRLIKKQQTHCKRGHPFDDGNTLIQSSGRRQCKECHRVAVRDGLRRWRAKQKEKANERT